MIRASLGPVSLAILLLGLPLLGVIMAGKPVAPYLEFPPTTRYVVHAAFSWPVFGGLSLLTLAAVLPFVTVLWRHRRQTETVKVLVHRFPWWGWWGLAGTAGFWLLAWTRYTWFAPVQAYTFTPLWLGYIIVINALTWRRTGCCLIIHRTRFLFALFVASAAFWWFFEYLNRFVQNWYYMGVSDYSAFEYFFHATLPFATVLPAVISTRDWLASYNGLSVGLDAGLCVSLCRPKLWATAIFIAAVFGLLGIGLWPNQLYPLVWVAPLLLIVSSQVLLGHNTVFGPAAKGDWRTLWLSALAAIQCGFFWEMWNFYSLAKWEYSIPYVHRFEIFEMPILGYAGYLPFGLECAVVGAWMASLYGNNVRQFEGGVNSAATDRI
ncbi:MAG TPA: hypothetical protein ENI80_10320 [Acidiferrobacteraceae bacterium]|nr:hypothetical protein [Acidiferrobacteraceae bacterium]